jgi:Flp pilus assembly protein TadD
MLESVKKYFVIFTYFVLILSTLLVFWQVRNFDFVNYDDSDYVYKNPHFSNGLNSNDVIWAFTTPNIGNWLPLTWLSFMLDSQLFGLDPGRMHLVNLLLHITNTLLLFAVLKKMTGSLWPSAFVAAAFAIHPVHVESVAWVIERKDVLSAFFFMLTMAAYVGYVRGGGLIRYLLTILLFVLGLLAKPMLVMLPLVLLLLDYWPLGRFTAEFAETAETRSEATSPLRKKYKKSSAKSPEQGWPSHAVSAVKSPVWLIAEKVPFLVLAAVLSVITFLAQKGSGSVPDISAIPLAYRIANTFLSYARYIGKMFWPQNLSVFYPLDIVRIPLWQIALCVLLVLVITIFAVRFGRKQRYLPVGWFWFIGTLIPVIGLVQSGAQGYADRYTYIPYIGLFIVIAWGLPELLSKWRYRNIALGMAAVIVLTVSGVCAYKQAGYWKNSVTLFTHALEVTQNNSVAHDCLGNYLRDNGKTDLAIEHYKKAIQFNQRNSMALNNLGIIMNDKGDVNKAIEYFQQAIKIEPDYTEAHYNIGVTYGALGRRQDAIEAYKQAIKIKPDYHNAHFNLGFAHYQLGRYQDAIEAYKRAIRIKPDFAMAHYALGVAYSVTGDKNSALEEYKILKTLDAEQANKLFDLINAK